MHLVPRKKASKQPDGSQCEHDGCPSSPDWEIVSYLGSRFSCTAHIPQLVEPQTQNRLVPIRLAHTRVSMVLPTINLSQRAAMVA